MQRYPAGDGWGSAGMSVDEDGRVYRFVKPASKVLVINKTGGDNLLVGINELITDPAFDSTHAFGPANDNDRVAEITKAQARAKGVLIAPGGSITLDCPIDPTHGRRGIWCVWFICDAGETATVQGGIIGM